MPRKPKPTGSKTERMVKRKPRTPQIDVIRRCPPPCGLQLYDLDNARLAAIAANMKGKNAVWVGARKCGGYHLSYRSKVTGEQAKLRANQLKVLQPKNEQQEETGS